MPRLLTLDEAADQLGVSKRGLRAEAERHGYIVRIGRKPLLDAAQLGELIEKCRDHPRERDSGGKATRATGTSATARNGSRPGPMIEDELTKRLPDSSPNKAGQ